MGSSSATRSAGQFKCVGAIRKAGFLSAKKWIVKRNQTIELARKQGWKRYWVCLRGSALLFNSVTDGSESKSFRPNQIDLLTWIQTNCTDQASRMIDSLMQAHETDESSRDEFLNYLSQCYIEREARHLILVDGSIAQPIPEHPKRDHVFCLSTAFGDAYLFQASCQIEADNWISAIHNACAAPLARNLTRDEAIKLFESRIRKLELETDKKFFLRQRLESRLTSMHSITTLSESPRKTDEYITIDSPVNEADRELKAQRMTMRALLARLGHQLLTLESHLENVHCEIYQLKCYLSSCSAQKAYYQSASDNANLRQRVKVIDLPHPRTLLMHVGRVSKLHLVRLGVFTVSSFHAYIHARQGSAENLLQKIQSWSVSNALIGNSPIKLNFLSQSISDSIFLKRQQDEHEKIESDTEKLIELSNLCAIIVRVSPDLYCKIRKIDSKAFDNCLQSDSSDDRYSLRHEGDWITINIRIHINSSYIDLVRRILSIIEPNPPEMEFLNYYLQIHSKAGKSQTLNMDKCISRTQVVAKRGDVLSDWNTFEFLELREKIVFELTINRSELDEESAPFGISIEAQLFTCKSDSLLNVYSSYIEWGSPADKAELADEDELLVINGSQTCDLDMMFVECMIQEATRLQIVVRSSRSKPPQNSILLDPKSLEHHTDDSDNDDESHRRPRDERQSEYMFQTKLVPTPGNETQVIPDEYIMSLVCPPPPTESKAFLRTDSELLRQKSDLSHGRSARSEAQCIRSHHDRPQPATDDRAAELSIGTVWKTKSELNFDSSLLTLDEPSNNDQPSDTQPSGATLTFEEVRQPENRKLSQSKGSLGISSDQSEQLSDPNQLERLRKSVVELIETEYAYIKHLERIENHYLKPMELQRYLGIEHLKNLGRTVSEILNLQKSFFIKLTNCALDGPESNIVDELDGRLNLVSAQTNSMNYFQHFYQPLKSIATIFVEESENFKVYANYCAVYSRLQDFLHPEKASQGSLPQGGSIISLVNSVDSFCLSNFPQGKGSSASTDSLLKPISSLISSAVASSNSSDEALLKHLKEFLLHLDADQNLNSSSSTSQISASSDLQAGRGTQSDKKAGNKSSSTFSSSSSSNTLTNRQKIIHQQNFESYLIKPIQRIVKYPMLLQSIVSSMGRQCDQDLGQAFQSAIKQMESIASHVNDSQRVEEEYGLVFDNIKRQYHDQQLKYQRQSPISPIGTGDSTPMVQRRSSHQPSIELDVEHLLYYGSVRWLNVSDFTSTSGVAKLKKGVKSLNLTQVLFVFNSCVVFICKEIVGKETHGSTQTNHQNPVLNNQNQRSRILSSSYQSTNLISGDQSRISSGNQLAQSTDSIEVIRYQTLIPVSEVQVRSVRSSSSSKNQNQNQFRWELFRCSQVNSNSNLLCNSNSGSKQQGKIYLLANDTNEARNIFLRKIRFIIRESVRNMSLPTRYSSSSEE